MASPGMPRREAVHQPGIHGQAVAFSPYHPNVFACAGGQYYGIAGCGQLSIFAETPQGIQEQHRLEWPDGLFACTWSEQNENHIVTGSGDGSLQLWDLGVPNKARGPIRVFKAHEKEVVSCHWDQSRGSRFISGSWDTRVHLWDPMSATPVSTYSEHLQMVYDTVWSPRKPGVFASVSGDCTLKIWDARTQPQSMQTFRAHEYEVLCCDWGKYDENLVVTGSVDKTIRGFDLRAGPGAPPLFILSGHSYAVRKVKCSPFHATLVASCSYDFSVRTWDFAKPMGRQQLNVFEDHTEFVVGVDFSMHRPGVLVDCSWDETSVVRTLP
eukprot:m.125863 g.125863  ORF g.125863 m.125863 type:complete len:325 (-) comp29160_c0_seq1:41-1015(-)